MDALGEWLAHFDTYTFMVLQEVASEGSSISEEVLEQDNIIPTDDANTTEEPQGEEGDGGGLMPPEDEENEDDDELTTHAPIIVSVGERDLLNPHLDYLGN